MPHQEYRSMQNPDTVPVADTTRQGRSALATAALVLLVVGGLNWALVGLFDFDLVAALFGDMTLPSRIVYVLVGLAAVVALTLLPRLSRRTA
jgi:uncharacterized membrane protein YuzA (DUF378 family)